MMLVVHEPRSPVLVNVEGLVVAVLLHNAAQTATSLDAHTLEPQHPPRETSHRAT